MSKFLFSYATRKAESASASSPAPTQIKISGSHDSNNYETILTLRNTSNGLPAYTKLGQFWHSDTIVADTAYRYLRFEVLKSTGPSSSSYGGRNFFAMSEFSIESPVTEIKELQPLYKGLEELYAEVAEEMASAMKVLADDSSKAADIKAAASALQAKYDELVDARNAAITGISGVETNASAKAGIYDISGRRVNQITAPGLYIINGQKRLVK